MSAEDAAKHLAAAPKQGAGQSLSAVMQAEDTDLDAPAATGPETATAADLARARHAN